MIVSFGQTPKKGSKVLSVDNTVDSINFLVLNCKTTAKKICIVFLYIFKASTI